MLIEIFIAPEGCPSCGKAQRLVRQVVPDYSGIEVREIHITEAPEGLIVSMWTEPEHRRRGLGRRIVESILAWGKANGVARFTLHASDDGRPLYELFGFRGTNEMRLG